MNLKPVDPCLHDFIGHASMLEDFVTSIRNPNVRRLAEVFRLNTYRAHQLAVSMIAIAHHAGQEQLRRCQARLKLGLQIDDTSKDETREFAVAYVQATEEWRDKRAEIGNEGLNALAQEDGSATLNLLVQTGLVFEEKQATVGTWAPSGVRGLLGAVVMMTYAAYEALATDLWELALNTNVDLAVKWLEGSSEKQIRLSEFVSHRFDLSRCMGTFLLRGNRVSFTSLKSITGSYEQAFGQDAKQCFEPRGELSATEQVRHLLAHRGGLIDSKFLRAVDSISEYVNLKAGQLLPMTGALAKRHSDSCVFAAIKTIEFVDGVIGEEGSLG